jgi:hypothetical protein
MKLEPIKPAPPVTKILLIMGKNLTNFETSAYSVYL